MECPITKLPKYITALIDADLIVKRDGMFSIRDPIMRRHLEIESEGLF